MATETPILDALLNANPVFFWGVIAAVILFAVLMSLAYKPGWQQRQEAEAGRAMDTARRQLMAKHGLKPDHFDAPPAIPRRAGLVEFLLQWRYLLHKNNKQADFTIAVPHDAWPEFNMALREVLPDIFVQHVLGDDINPNETKIVGFKFVPKPRYFPLPGEPKATSNEEIIKQAYERIQPIWIPKAQPSRSPKPKPKSPRKPRRKSPKKASKRR